MCSSVTAFLKFVFTELLINGFVVEQPSEASEPHTLYNLHTKLGKSSISNIKTTNTSTWKEKL